MTRPIAVLVFPGFQLLDAAGPIATFEIASHLLAGAYRITVVATVPGPVASSSGVELTARRLPRPERIDTLVVAGGDGTRRALACPETLAFVRACARRARRVASVCSGSYLLAAAGLLDGATATTHWSRTPDFAQRFPRVRLDADRIFVRSGHLWTSAGISAGIDLSLALVGDDLGEAIARRTARELVVYHRRPGGQSQYSALLELVPAGERFGTLLDAIRSDLRARWGVTELAANVAMSPRHFARTFRQTVGTTPAKAVERLRAEAARAALESGAASIHDVARESGFGDAERMRRAFVRLWGTPPATLKRRGRASAAQEPPLAARK